MAKDQENMPAVPDKVPTKPAAQTEAESEIWDYYKAVLDEYKLFTVTNGPLLNMLARIHYEWDLINTDIEQRLMFGTQIEDLEKIFKIRDKHAKTMLGLYKQMGIGATELIKLGSLMLDSGKKDDKHDPHGFFR